LKFIFNLRGVIIKNMKKYCIKKINIVIYWLIIVSILLINIGCVGCLGIKKKREKETLAILNDCANWFITKGLADYYRNKYFDEISNYITKKNAFLYYNKILAVKDKFLAQIIIWRLWISCDITCYERIKNQGMIYEYWIISYGSKRKDFDYRISFLVAKAESLTKPRKIIYQSDKFFLGFPLTSETQLKFPINKMGAIFEMRPWDHLGAFRGTELENLKEDDVRKKIFE